MMKILYVPLDDRDCNALFPSLLAEMTPDARLICPPREIMGCKKTPANVDALWQWVFSHASECACAIFSIDTLVYGNLISARLHHLSHEVCQERLNRLRCLKALCPGLRIHAFNLVTRVAAYNNCDEDPDYWQEHGYDIWRYTYLIDKISRGQASSEEIAEQSCVRARIPDGDLSDFLARRTINRAVNLASVDLLADSVLDALTIPKDDTAEYGYAAMDHAALHEHIRARKLAHKVLVHPGADEVGAVHFARLYCLAHHFQPRICVRYSSTLAPTIVPLFEDRPLHEGVKAQIVSLGGILVSEESRADCLLAINGPGARMVESYEPRDLTHQTHIQTRELLEYTDYFMNAYRKPAGLADVSVANGCDAEFMELAHLMGVDQRVTCLGGWNTAQNTLGLVLTQLAIAACRKNFENDPAALQRSREFLLRSLAYDWLYLANVLPGYFFAHADTDIFHLNERAPEMLGILRRQLEKTLCETYPDGFCGQAYTLDEMEFTWNNACFLHLKLTLH